MGFPGSICRKGHETEFSEKYDSFYCLKCDYWWDEKCTDATCEFCSTRPDKPSMMKKEEPEDV